MNASELVVETLSSAGINLAFGIPGNSLMDATDYMFRTGKMRFVTVRHEQVAAGMAEGYARVTRLPGVCVGGAGPSAANLIIGVANAYRASVPLFVLTGDLSRNRLGRDSLNEWDQMAMFKPITKHQVQITDSKRLASQVRLALSSAVAGRPGPVQVDLPADVGEEDVAIPGPAPDLDLGPTRTRAPKKLVEEAVRLIQASERPVIIAGGGAGASISGRALGELARSFSIPVAVSGARGIMSEMDPLCFGPVGVWGYSSCNALVSSADLLIGLGFRFSDDTTMGWTTVSKGTKIIQVDIDPGEIGRQYPADVGIVADVDTFLKQVLSSLKSSAKKPKGWPKERLKELQEKLAKERTKFLSPPFEKEPVDKRVIVRDVMEFLEGDAIITVGTGTHARYGNRMIVEGSQSLFRSGAFAAMGFAFPAAMGAAIASPERQAVCLDGDGDFMMTVQDLETAVRERIPVITVVFNNGTYAAYRFAKHHGRRVGVEFTNPDMVKLAESFGAQGIRVERSQDFKPALKQMLDSGKPAVIDAVVTEGTDLPWY